MTFKTPGPVRMALENVLNQYKETGDMDQILEDLSTLLVPGSKKPTGILVNTEGFTQADYVKLNQLLDEMSVWLLATGSPKLNYSFIPGGL